MKFYNEHVFTWFLTHVLKMRSNFNIFEHNESYKEYVIGSFYKKWSPKKSMSFIVFEKFTKDWNFLLFLSLL